jgi:hypothetical protein
VFAERVWARESRESAADYLRDVPRRDKSCKSYDISVCVEYRMASENLSERVIKAESVCDEW